MKNRHTPFLSKSKYLAGLQCMKLLWYLYNRKQDIPEIDAATQAIMDQGNAVGELARTLYPGGIKLDREAMPERQAERSLEAARLRNPLFEAGFVYKRAYALADILVPVGADAWDLIEVKSTSSVKDEHLYDVAFQRYTYEGAGLKIRRCYLMHINNQYVREGEIEAKKLLKKEDITEEVSKFVPEIEKEIGSMVDAIAVKDVPDVKVGRHCNDPYECPLQDICWAFLPPEDDVFCLYRGGKKAYELMDKGILSLADICGSVKLTNSQRIQVDSHGRGKPHVDKEGIREFLDRLKYPLYFLDFETISAAIPLYDHSRPFEQIPFQYSLHIIRKEGGRPESYSYIAPDRKDPRPAVLKQLKELLGESGSVIAYNAGFEKTVLKKASEYYPEYKTWVNKIDKRVVDLLAPFRSFFYYHPGQAGSASIKDVLPALTGSGYKNMEIADGNSASTEYHRVTFGDNIAIKDRARVHAALEKYCALDTKGMIDILDALRKEVG
jgi:hypothetical protein